MPEKQRKTQEQGETDEGAPTDLTPADIRLFRMICEALLNHKPRYLNQLPDLVHDPCAGDPGRFLKGIEHGLGYTDGELIGRKKQGPVLTLTGQRVYAKFCAIEQEFQKSMGECRKREEERVNIVTTISFGMLIVPFVLRHSSFFEHYHNIEMHIRPAEWIEARELLARKAVDFAFFPNSPCALTPHAEKLRTLRRVFLYPATGDLKLRFSHLLADGSNFDKDLLKGITIFHLPDTMYPQGTRLQAWLPHDRERRRVILDHQALVRNCVARGLGVAISHEMPPELESQEKSLVTSVSLESQLGSLDLCLYYAQSDEELTEPAKDLATAIREYCLNGWDS